MKGPPAHQQPAFEPANWWTSSGPTEELRESVADIFQMTPIESDQNTGMYRARSWYARDCLIVQTWSDAAIARRDKAQGARCANLVFLQRYVRGSIRGVSGDLNIDRDQGEVFLFDQEREIDCVQMPLFVQGVYFPKQVLGYRSGVHPAHIRFSENRTMKKLIDAEMDRLFKQLLRSDSPVAPPLDRLISCLKVALGSDEKDGDVRRHARDAMTDLICAHIENNLDSWTLGVDSLLGEFGVSRASLYRMFEDKGGVRQYISDRRLYRAVIEISRRPHRRGTISATAEKWMFASDATFNRAVKRKFGVTPRSLINASESEDLDLHARALETRAYFQHAQARA